MSPWCSSTISGGTPSVSAAICENDVAVPCPCGDTSVTMTTRPSGFISTRARLLRTFALPPDAFVTVATPMPVRNGPRSDACRSRRPAYPAMPSARSNAVWKSPESYSRPVAVR